MTPVSTGLGCVWGACRVGWGQRWGRAAAGPAAARQVRCRVTAAPLEALCRGLKSRRIGLLRALLPTLLGKGKAINWGRQAEPRAASRRCHGSRPTMQSSCGDDDEHARHRLGRLNASCTRDDRARRWLSTPTPPCRTGVRWQGCPSAPGRREDTSRTNQPDAVKEDGRRLGGWPRVYTVRGANDATTPSP